MVGVLSCSV